MKKMELLAPAGSYESMTAAISAGADAVYMGGSRFGARAYAENPDEEMWLKAIDYAHLHGRQLYMTVNTLTKEAELEALYDYLLPYYRQGLDAVIVQDMGVFTYIKEQFPDLPIHASTQMTITGYHGAKLLKDLGAARVVTARELSLAEIAEIKKQVDIEIESFVHGALCYCYSGQCLLSSFIGGRSGNRGRCAQPCRLPYDVVRGSEVLNSKNEQYVLSLKDLCTLDIIPDMIESGVYSMKIEGRMKSPRYTAGVVSIYRKYADRYLASGREGYRVDKADRTRLLDLFDRGGLTEGYYRQHNGRDMVALKEKPAFRAANQELFEYLDQTYINHKMQKPVSGVVMLTEGKPASLELWSEQEQEDLVVSVTGAIVQSAKNQPLSQERLAAQMKKTGNTPFVFQHLQVKLEGACFLPMQEINELRRLGLKELEEQLMSGYRRPSVERAHHRPIEKQENAKSWTTFRLHVTIEQPEHLAILLNQEAVSEISVDAAGFSAEAWRDTVSSCHRAGKTCFLLLPHIFRQQAEQYFTEKLEHLKAAGFDGFLVRSLEEVGFLNQRGIKQPLIFDYTMYGMNQRAAKYYSFAGADRQTLPLELNSRELEVLGCEGKELVIYGYLPAMVSAQCITKTMSGCNRKSGLLFLKDRKGKQLPVRNYCRFCYNTIYNTSPLSLLGSEDLIRRLRPSVLRLQFTIETAREVNALLQAYTESFIEHRPVPNPLNDFTRGHFKRGIE